MGTKSSESNLRKRVTSVLIPLVPWVLLACGKGDEAVVAQKAEPPPTVNRQGSVLAASALRSGVSYSIIGEASVPGMKRSLDVRLRSKASAQELELVARELKARDRSPYERTFISYYLPGMPVGSGAWATTHFTPALEVKILGLSLADEAALSDGDSARGGALVGAWLDQRPVVSSRLSIRSEGGKLTLERKFKDSSSFECDLIEKQSPRGRRFDCIQKPRWGDHWIVTPKGDLELRDDDGLVTTASRMD